jgi:hypothetical protein
VRLGLRNFIQTVTFCEFWVFEIFEILTVFEFLKFWSGQQILWVS